MKLFKLLKSLRKSFLPASLVAIALLLAGCGGNTAATTPEPGTFSIDPIFREFYASLGGQDVLGPAITALFTFRSQQCQYTVNALLCFDPLQQGIDRYSLFPLGEALGIRDEPGAAASGDLVVDGYQIYEEFEELYHKLYGPLYAGRPLSQPRFNSAKNRIEQYFANVGFYRDLGDPGGKAHLLAYGVYACDSDCRYSPPQSGIVVTSVESVEQPFLTQIARLGGLNVFGLALSEPYIAPDGRLEQVYENVVLSAPQEDPNSVSLRSLPVLLGMPTSPPGPKIYNEAEGVIFYGIENELGYHVPLPFDHFIAQHGGREISGNPIGEVTQLGADVYRQCFEHYCLLYDRTAGDDQKVRMAPLGREYLRLAQGGQVEQETPFVFSPDSVHLLVHAGKPRVSAAEAQIFEMTLLRASDQQPIADVEAELTLTLPDGRQERYSMPPTGSDGRAALSVDPLRPAPDNGSVIAYRVCLNIPASEPICSADSYLIWNLQ
jgi:hypothetical protein